jgi:hypothetical protein
LERLRRGVGGKLRFFAPALTKELDRYLMSNI